MIEPTLANAAALLLWAAVAVALGLLHVWLGLRGRHTRSFMGREAVTP